MLGLLVVVVIAVPLEGDVSLTLDRESGAFFGTFSSTLPDGPALLASYVAALSEPYTGDDVDRLWDYPGTPEGTALVWDEVRVDGQKIAVEPGTKLVSVRGKRVEAAFHSRVPRRYGALGRVGDDFLLVAPAPFVVGGVLGASRMKDARALQVRWRVSVRAIGPGQWLRPLVSHEGDPTQLVLASAALGFEPSPPSRGRSPVARFRPRPHRFGAESELSYTTPFGNVFDPDPESAARERVRTHESVAARLSRFGVPAQRWLEAPLRREHAICAKDVLLVSRELFRTFPTDLIWRFHRWGLERAAYACAFQHAFGWSAEDADALGYFLSSQADRAQAVSYSAKELLRPLSFIPDIDSLIYAPQMTWAALYFSAVHEPAGSGPPEPGRFFHPRPNGKLFYEKLRDRVGEAAARALFLRALHEQRPPIALAQAAFPRDADIILQDFFGAYPEYDVGFSVEGASVHLEKRGPGKDAREPIEVRVEDSAGVEHRGRFAGDSAQGEVRFPKAVLPLQEIEVDPEHRLVELYFNSPSALPRFDNSTSHELRIMLNRLAASFGFSAAELTARLAFTIRRENDLANYFGFGAYYDPSGLGLTGRYSYAFGPRITADDLAYYVSAGLFLERLTKGFAGAAAAVYTGSALLSVGHDDRVSGRSSMKGFAWNVYAGLGLPLGRGMFGYFGASALKIFPLAYAHALGVKVRVDTTVGDAPLQVQPTLGGRFEGRGFPQGELVGGRRLLGALEYRHEIGRGLRANILDLFFIDGLEGALFADVILIGDRLDRLFDRSSLFGDVGYGIRFLFDQLGVNPGMMAIDVGVPLKRPDPKRLPISVYVDFVQSL